MRTSLLSKTIVAATFAAMLSTTSSVFAQVKIGSSPTVIATNTNLDVQSTDGNRTVVLKDNGFVGIGTVTPTNLLTLGPSLGSSVSAVAGKKMAVYQNAAGSDFYGLGVNAGVLQFHASASPEEAPGMVLTSAGNVGINTTSPGVRLEVVETVNPFFGSVIARFSRPGNKFMIFETTATTGAYSGLVKAGDSHIIFSTDGDPAIGAEADNGFVIAPWSLNQGSLGMKIMENGNVGIDIASPLAPLHVGLSKTINSSLPYLYFNIQSGALTPAAAGAQPISIYAAGSIVSGNGFLSTNGVITSSDARIKDVIGRSNSRQDLATLRTIEITDYALKDKVKFGNKQVKKVIAQQLETVYPKAVSRTADFIPNIYAQAQHIAINGKAVTITLAKAPELNEGDEVRLYTKNNEEVYTKVTALTGNSFTVTLDNPESDYFVFGKKVNDFRAVDYDAISMLNVSATQELAREVEQLKAQNQVLQSKVAQIDELKAEMASIKALLGVSKEVTQKVATK